MNDRRRTLKRYKRKNATYRNSEHIIGQISKMCMESLKNMSTKEFKKASQKHPYMGLNNEICKDPAYWCRLHEVYLSEEDVEKKKCKCKPTFDVIGVIRCGNLEERR